MVFEKLNSVVQSRAPGFCTGCPERPIFSAMKLVERELGPHHVSADIGCHLFSILPPFNIGNTTMGMGWSRRRVGPQRNAGKRAISVMGDGGFWHNGLTSGIGNAVFNESNNVIVSSITAIRRQRAVRTSCLRAGRRPIAALSIRSRTQSGSGRKWVKTLRSHIDVAKMRDTLREALTTPEKGPKVIVAASECMLNKQRREKPLMRKLAKEGKRVVRARFGVDPDTCTGDHSCIRISGCPSLTIQPNPDPLRKDPIARVENSCVGCGLCGENVHAAALCPSFYRADIISNPTRWDRWREAIQNKVIGFLQRRVDRELTNYAV